MFWPRLVLTPEEQLTHSKYYDPDSKKRGVLRRIYQGSLESNDTEQQPFWNFEIARRCRVFALTGIGDVNQIRFSLQDATGEQYFSEPLVATQVFGGWAATGLSPNNPITGNVTGYENTIGMPACIAPMVFEPNIVLAPNQVLNIIGQPVVPFNGVVYRVDLAIHVWEFP